MPIVRLFDEQVQRMGQANMRRWVDDILPLVSGDDDPLGTETFACSWPALARTDRQAVASP